MRCFSSPGSPPAPMYSGQDDPKGPGFPIRKSADQSLLTAPHGFSQRATSFIASRYQGIHQMPLRRLIPVNPVRTGESPRDRTKDNWTNPSDALLPGQDPGKRALSKTMVLPSQAGPPPPRRCTPETGTPPLEKKANTPIHDVRKQMTDVKQLLQTRSAAWWR